MNHIDYTTEDLAEALRDADLGRAYAEARRLKIASIQGDQVSTESFADLASALETLLSRLAGTFGSPGRYTPSTRANLQ
jgi:hypothetical protein